ncbi:MAG: hypothetical protein PHE29_02035 [Tissierellia bacterium]|nr:hypothetical protein [Tissierellia bacterium]
MTENRLYKLQNIYTKECTGCDLSRNKYGISKCKGEGLCRSHKLDFRNWKRYRKEQFK